jgi:hypothetical protein
MNLKRVSIVLLLALACMAMSAFAQDITISGGPSVYAETPFAAANLNVTVCPKGGSTCSFTSFEGRGDLRVPGSFVYGSSTGVLYKIATANTPALTVDLFGFGQVGGSVTSSASGINFPVGGGIAVHPAKAPNWSVSFSAKEVYSSVNATTTADSKWKPWAGATIGYTFHAVPGASARNRFRSPLLAKLRRL